MCNLLSHPIFNRALTAAQPLGYHLLTPPPSSDCDVARELQELISSINVMREHIEDIERLQKWIQEVEIFPILTSTNRHSRRSIPDDSRKENFDIQQHLLKLTERIDRNMQSILNLESIILNENRRLRNHLLRV